MKFVYKISLWTIIIMAVAFGLSGYLFVDSVFQKSFEQHQQAVLLVGEDHGLPGLRHLPGLRVHHHVPGRQGGLGLVVAHVQRLRRKMGWEENLVAVYKVGYRLEI